MMSMTRYIMAGSLAAGLLIATAPIASATPVFEGNSTAQFDDGTQLLEFAGLLGHNSTLKLTDGGPFSVQSGNTSLGTSGDPFTLFNLKYTNNLLGPGWGDEDFVVETNVAISSPAGVSDFDFDIDGNVAFKLIGGDVISIDLDNNEIPFTVNGVGGVLTIHGFYANPAYANPYVDSFSVKDLHKADYDVHASFAVAPLPAAAWGGLALLGLMGGARTLRRKLQRDAA